MSLKIGNITANTGMSKAIYDQINTVLTPSLDEMSEEGMVIIRESWQKLAFAVATGVVEHIKSNMEISGVDVSINDVSTAVNVETNCPSGPGTGSGTGSGTATGQQSNDGTGHVI